MSDRELLEAAAKAADLNIGSWNGSGFNLAVYNEFSRTTTIRGWNPLTDDGDAFRLAVALRLTVETAANGDCSDTAAYRPGRPDVAAVEWVGMDSDNAPVATRRAIVRCAAALTPLAVQDATPMKGAQP